MSTRTRQLIECRFYIHHYYVRHYIIQIYYCSTYLDRGNNVLDDTVVHIDVYHIVNVYHKSIDKCVYLDHLYRCNSVDCIDACRIPLTYHILYRNVASYWVAVVVVVRDMALLFAIHDMHMIRALFPRTMDNYPYDMVPGICVHIKANDYTFHSK